MTLKRGAIIAGCAVGLLLAIRIYNQAFRNNVWRAHQVVLRSDLRNFAAAEEAYRDRTGAFATDIAALGDSAFRASEGVSLRILEGTDSTVRAEGTHRDFADGAACTIVVGETTARGVVQCRGFVDWLYRPRLAR